MSRQPFSNWAHNHVCWPKRRHQPGSVEEVRALIRQVRAANETLRVVGAGHSWTDIACTDDHLVSLDRLCDVISVDRARARITVGAGMRLHRLVEVVAEAGLGLVNLGSITEQSVAGAISTGTHGTGVDFGNLATQVVAMEMVTGTGELLSVDERDADRLDACRVSLGCLGIITQVTIQCEPAFDLAEITWSLRFDEAVEQLPQLVGDNQHMKLWWLPHTDTVQVCTMNRTRARPRGSSPLGRLVDDWVNRYGFEGVLALGRRYPRLIPRLNGLVARAYFRPRHRVDRSDRIFTVPMPPRHRESEFAIAVEGAGVMMRRVRALIAEQGLRVNFVQELRFAAGDKGWLSPAFARDTCHFGGYVGDTQDADRYLSGFEAIALDLGGRPHWGKLFDIHGDALRARYPRFEDFRALRAELDPDGVFDNDYIRRVFA